MKITRWGKSMTIIKNGGCGTDRQKYYIFMFERMWDCGGTGVRDLENLEKECGGGGSAKIFVPPSTTIKNGTALI